jgi:hypothetical protein
MELPIAQKLAVLGPVAKVPRKVKNRIWLSGAMILVARYGSSLNHRKRAL